MRILQINNPMIYVNLVFIFSRKKDDVQCRLLENEFLLNPTTMSFYKIKVQLSSIP